MEQVDINELMDVSKIPGFDSGDETITPYEPLVLKDIDSNPDNRSKDLDNDYSSVRQNLYYQNQMIMDAAKIFLESAKNSESPRHMEVFAALMGQATTTNRELMKIHKDMRDITDETTGSEHSPKEEFRLSSPTDRMTRFGSSYDVIDVTPEKVENSNE